MTFLLILMSLLIVFLIYVIWTLRRTTNPNLQFDCGAPLSDLFPSLAGLSQGMPTDGNTVEVFENGAFYEEVISAIGKAEKSVHFETFLWKKGRLASRVADALIKRSEAGVAVRIMLDANGSKDMDEETERRFRSSSCQFVKFHNVRPRKIGFLNKRNHRKIVVIDGKTAYVGGHCIADEWLYEVDGKAPYSDVSVRVEGPIVRAVQSTFAENWIESTGNLFVGDAVFPALEKVGTLKMHVAHIRPEGGVSGVKVLHRIAICCAKERICIQTPYFLPDQDIIYALGEAVERGVDVRLMVPSIKATDEYLFQLAAHHNYEKLLSLGIRLFEYEKTLLHQKVMTIDGYWCGVGSSNFDHRSFEINDEITLSIYDDELAARFDAIFEKDLECCTERKLQEWNRRSLKDRVKSHILYMFRAQL